VNKERRLSHADITHTMLSAQYNGEAGAKKIYYEAMAISYYRELTNRSRCQKSDLVIS